LNRKEAVILADVATTNISDYVNRMGIKIAALSRGTGISDDILRRSIVKKQRSLRFDEAIEICRFIDKDPFEFYQGAGIARADEGQRRA